MSPRRRGALVAVVVVALLVVLGLVTQQRRGTSAPQDALGPVLLVPGYGGDTGSLEPLAAALRSAGRDAAIVPAVGDGTGDLRDQAAALARAADARIAAGAPSVDVVGYSAGGVVARIWVADLGGGELARRVVTLGSPHHGTSVAGLGAAVGACPPACQQLVEGSDLLSGLPDAPDGPLWVSLWTGQDETVTPPESALLAGALDVEVGTICSNAQVSHAELPRNPVVVGLVLRALALEPLEDVPPPTDCVGLQAAGAGALGLATEPGS